MDDESAVAGRGASESATIARGSLDTYASRAGRTGGVDLAAHGTFFQVLSTPRPFARFPFFNMMNNEDAFGALVLRPHDKLMVSGEFHSLRLADAHDGWYIGGGVYQPWTFGYSARSASGTRSLANLYDQP